MPRMLVATTVTMTMEAFLLPHVKHLRNLGWTVDGMSSEITASSACVDAFDAVHEVDWSRRPLSLANIRAVKQVADVVRSGGYDIVHVHTPVASFVTRYALHRFSGPGSPHVIYTAHGFHFSLDRSARANAVFGTLERLAGRWTDRLVVINEQDEEQARSLGIVASSAVLRVPGVGIDPDVWDRAAISLAAMAAAAQDVGVLPGERHIVCVGEFNPGKRQADVVKAFSAARLAGARLIFLGEGPERGACEVLADRLGIAGLVTFAGQRLDVREVLAGAAMLVHASEREGLPRSVMEAMSLGAPVVAVSARGTSDLLADGRGLLVPVGDTAALATAMQKAFVDSALVASLTARARAYVVSDLSLSHVLAMMDELYSSVMAEREEAGQ